MKLGYQKYTLARGLEKIKTRTALVLAAFGLLLGSGAASLAVIGTTHAAPATVVVSPGNQQGWAFFDDNGHGGSGSFVSGPGTPPLGTGSAQLSVDAADQGYALGGTSNGGVKLSDLTAVSYSTYVQQGNDTIAPALQFNVDQDVTDTNTAYQGRLVYEPYQNGTVTDGQWQTWNALPGVWWLSRSDTQFNGNCGQASPCTFAQLEALYPNMGILNGTGNVIFKAGSGWTVPFVGNVDGLTLGTAASTTTYNFELVTPDTTAPAVAITSPANGSTVAGTVDVRGTVTDANPNHYYLEITNDSTGTVEYSKVTNDSQSFTNALLYSWDTTQVPDGNYTILLAARDNAGNRSGNVTVDVTVNNTPDNQEQCKDGGWASFTKPAFKNQGQCVAYTNHNNGVGQDDVHAR